jgi:hypothetical protein
MILSMINRLFLLYGFLSQIASPSSLYMTCSCGNDCTSSNTGFCQGQTS